MIMEDQKKGKTATCESVEVKVRDAEMAQERAERIINEGAHVPVNLKQTGRLPPWYDAIKFKRGQDFFHQNYFALFVSKLAGLILVLAIANILRVLKLTRKSGDKISAYKRYMGTIHHMLMWYDGDLQDPESKACKSLIRVRGFHCAASNKASCVGFGHISQQDMALTQFGFMGFCMVNFKNLGLKGSQEQLEGFVHFWKTIGYLMGINEKYNLCDGGVEETEETCRIVLEKMFVPSLEKKDPDFIHMSTALMEGMRPVVPVIDVGAFMGFTRFLCGLQHDECLSSFYSRAIYNYQIFVHRVILSTPVVAVIFRPLLNFLMWFGLLVCRKYPTVTLLHFGRKVDIMEDEEPPFVMMKPKHHQAPIAALSRG